jgi:hypothetical protein
MKVKMPSNWGIALLSIWLILFGLNTGFNLTFVYERTVLAILAVAAGICLLLGC